MEKQAKPTLKGTKHCNLIFNFFHRITRTVHPRSFSSAYPCLENCSTTFKVFQVLRDTSKPYKLKKSKRILSKKSGISDLFEPREVSVDVNGSVHAPSPSRPGPRVCMRSVQLSPKSVWKSVMFTAVEEGFTTSRPPTSSSFCFFSLRPLCEPLTVVFPFSSKLFPISCLLLSLVLCCLEFFLDFLHSSVTPRLLWVCRPNPRAWRRGEGGRVIVIFRLSLSCLCLSLSLPLPPTRLTSNKGLFSLWFTAKWFHF